MPAARGSCPPAWVSLARLLVDDSPVTADLQSITVVPLSTMQLYGHDVYVPKSPEKLLEINYGPSWREPDPSFKFKFGEHSEAYWFLYKKQILSE